MVFECVSSGGANDDMLLIQKKALILAGAEHKDHCQLLLYTPENVLTLYFECFNRN